MTDTLVHPGELTTYYPPELLDDAFRVPITDLLVSNCEPGEAVRSLLTMVEQLDREQRLMQVQAAASYIGKDTVELDAPKYCAMEEDQAWRGSIDKHTLSTMYMLFAMEIAEAKDVQTGFRKFIRNMRERSEALEPPPPLINVLVEKFKAIQTAEEGEETAFGISRSTWLEALEAGSVVGAAVAEKTGELVLQGSQVVGEAILKGMRRAGEEFADLPLVVKEKYNRAVLANRRNLADGTATTLPDDMLAIEIEEEQPLEDITEHVYGEQVIEFGGKEYMAILVEKFNAAGQPMGKVVRVLMDDGEILPLTVDVTATQAELVVQSLFARLHSWKTAEGRTELKDIFSIRKNEIDPALLTLKLRILAAHRAQERAVLQAIARSSFREALRVGKQLLTELHEEKLPQIPLRTATSV